MSTPLPSKSTHADAELPAADELGELGVRQLKRFLARTILGAGGRAVRITNEEWVHDKVLLYGLGLPLQETLKFIYGARPTLAEFESYVLNVNNGRIDDALIARINASLAGEDPDENTRREIESIDAMAPVLSDAELAFWDENGYVIVREAISREEAGEAATAVWNFLGAEPSNPDSWYRRGPKEGIWVKAFNLEASKRIRRSSRIRKAFAQLWGTSDLWTTIDSVGFNPPEIAGRYVFPGPNLHWDRSLARPLAFGTQGVLYLNDVAENQGAFTCVAGFHRKLDAWLAELPAGIEPRDFDLTTLGPRPIAANAGDLVIWHQSLPHGSSPNRARFPRLVQYINMFPNRRDDSDDWI